MSNLLPQHTNIASEVLRVERKTFFWDLRINERGTVLKLTEDVNGRRNTIMLPAEALREAADILNRLADFADTIG